MVDVVLILILADKHVIDYVIMSPELFPSIHYFEVLEFDPLFSDIHCPVAFTMNMKSQENVILPNEENLVTVDLQAGLNLNRLL